jgi:hypothetical protein
MAEIKQQKHDLKGDWDARSVWLDRKLLTPSRSQAVVNHSPDGFNWGYGGSGPAHLALAIILALTGKSDGYQDFKWDFIAKLPTSSFEVTFMFPLNKESADENLSD